MLYAFSQESIHEPVNYALKQLSTALPTGAGGVYDELAAYAPIDLISLAVETSGTRRSGWPELPAFSSDPLWESTIGPVNPRIGVLFYILTGAKHPLPGLQTSQVKITTKTE